MREGTAVYDYYNPPKTVIGETDLRAGDTLVEFYKHMDAPLIRTDIERAEMDLYHRVFKNLQPPGIVGFNVWGRIDDYRFFRYAFASCLMDNGYFSFTDEAKGYSSVPWFDEYDIKLGKALDPPQLLPKHDGVYFRRFENGLVFVNPRSAIATVSVAPGYRRLLGKQDTSVNDGTPVVKETLLPPESGLILIKQQ